MTIELRDVGHSYRTRTRTVRSLQGVTFSVDPGCLVAISGPSGAGKTTLLRLLGCQLRVETGTIIVDGTPIPRPESQDGARYRSTTAGFVFAEYGLIERDSALRNVTLPLRYAGVPRRRAAVIAAERLERVGLDSALARAPVAELSAGQRQRVAVARAQANGARLILADEPTNSLDPENTRRILDHLREAAEDGATVIIATHEESVQQACDRTVWLRRGHRVEPPS